MNREEYIQPFTKRELKKVAYMLKRAEEKGMTVLVVHTALDLLSSDADMDIDIAIDCALKEWDCN